MASFHPVEWLVIWVSGVPGPAPLVAAACWWRHWWAAVMAARTDVLWRAAALRPTARCAGRTVAAVVWSWIRVRDVAHSVASRASLTALGRCVRSPCQAIMAPRSPIGLCGLSGSRAGWVPAQSDISWLRSSTVQLCAAGLANTPAQASGECRRAHAGDRSEARHWRASRPPAWSGLVRRREAVAHRPSAPVGAPVETLDVGTGEKDLPENS